MPIVISSNVAALKVQNELTRATTALNTSLERLSTGLKINSAKDDPAGYYYSQGIYSQVRGSNIAYNNVQIGANMLTLASGDLTNINTQVERIKDLATQYANSTLSAEEQAAIKAEASQRVAEINRIVSDSKFNKLQLLDGSQGSALRLQVGSGSDPSTNAIYIKGVFDNADAAALNLIGGSSKFSSIDEAFANASAAAEFIDIAQASADIVTKRIADAGVYSSRLESVTNSLLTRNENLNSAYSTVVEADVATETSNYIKYSLIQQTASSMLAQANQLQGSLAMKLVSVLG